MKKILIVIMDMGMGGAQKSLLGFLEAFAQSAYETDHRVDLMVVKPGGALWEQIPSGINVVEPPKELRWLGMPLGRELFAKYFSLRSLWGEFCWLFRSRTGLFPRKFNQQQRLWSCWRHLVPELPKKYDVAVSYIDGFTNYYVMEKVRADKKVLWIHNEYQKHGYDIGFDRMFYEACDGIITISEQCRQCVIQAFPQCGEKVYVLENITSYKRVTRKSEEGTCPEYMQTEKLKLLSVGRLNHVKGFDLAIGAAKRLKEVGIPFLWLIVGEGPERQKLQEQIDRYALGDHFRLIGARSNPYPYMKACDILVQPSRSEGKSMVLDEAKMLCKPIVTTNYTTVWDSVEHGVSGWIVDMTEEAVYDGILRMYRDPLLRTKICDFLKASPKGNEEELEQYIGTMF